MNNKRRRAVLFVALAGVLAWSFWLAIQPESAPEDSLVADVVGGDLNEALHFVLFGAVAVLA